MKLAHRCSTSLCRLLLLLAVAFTVVEARAVSTWRAIADSRNNNAVWMASTTIGWAVGDSGAISQTSDGGVTWVEKTSGVSANLTGVWGADTNHVWAVGTAGTIVFWNGASWAAQTSGVTTNLSAVMGANLNAVWAVGATGTLLEWNGAAWVKQNAPAADTALNFYGLWVGDSNNVWAVGQSATACTIIKFNGGTSLWSALTTPVAPVVDLHAIWGSSNTNIYAVGVGGNILHSTDGATWAAITPALGTALNAISGIDSTHIWVGGANGFIDSYNGVAFTSQTTVPATTQTISGISAVGTGIQATVVAVGALRTFDVVVGDTPWSNATTAASTTNNAVWMASSTQGWAVGNSGTIFETTDGGNTWVPQTSGVVSNLLGVWGTDTSHVWAVGQSGTILFWNGTVWAAQTSGVAVNLQAVRGAGSAAIWAVGASGTLLFSSNGGTTWAPQTAPAGTTATTFYGLWVQDATDVWAVGAANTIIKFNGTAWAVQTSTATGNPDLHAVWGSSGTNLLAVGAGGAVLQSLDGVTWNLLTTLGSTLNGVFGTNATHVWAVGGAGLISYYNGTTWVTQAGTGSQTLNGVAAVSTGTAATVVAVGALKTFDVFNGSPWSNSVSNINTTFNAIWGLDDDKMWAVGGAGAIYFWNGGTWTKQTSNTGATLYGIWGTDVNHVWAVGSGGTVDFWNGSTWTASTPGGSILYGIHGTSSTNIWAVGALGTIIQWNGGSWNAVNSSTGNTLYGVFAQDATHAWAVGVLGTIIKYGTTATPTGTTLSWTTDFSPAGTNSLLALQGIPGTGYIWAVGTNGTIIEHNSTFWEQQGFEVTTGTLSGSAPVSTTNQWAVGAGGILHGNGTTWTADGSLPVAGITPVNAFATGTSTVFVLASNGMVFVNSLPAVPEITVNQVVAGTPPVSTPLLSNQPAIDYGTVNAPATSTYTFTVTNTSSTGTSLANLALTKTGSDPTDYTVSALASNGTPVTSLLPQTSATFTVKFTPTIGGTRTATINIASTDLDEPLFKINVTAVAQLPPTITKQPLSQTVNPGTSVTFTTAATGTVTPAVPLSYAWRFSTDGINWTPIAGQTGVSYKITGVTAGNAGYYDVQVTNIVSTTTSTAAKLGVNTAVNITTVPLAQSASVGSSVTFTTAVDPNSTLPITYQWRKNGVSIAGATGATYTIPSVLTTHAGLYSVAVKNIVGTVISPAAPSTGVQLNVVDTSVKNFVLVQGATATFPTSYGGVVTSFTWNKGGSPVTTADPRITGYTSKTLTIKTLAPADSGLYTCVLGFATGNLTATFNLIVYNAPPQFNTSTASAGVFSLPAAIVRGVYLGYQIPVNPDVVTTPASPGNNLQIPATYAVSGLPTGLTVNALTGSISGTPTVALTADKTYNLVFTITNAKGHATYPATLLVHALLPGTVGVFSGPVARSGTILDNNLGGRFDLTTTTAGAFTGKVTLGASANSFAGVLTIDITGMNKPHGVATIKRLAPATPLTVSFDIDLVNNVLANGQVSDGATPVNTATYSAWRNEWGATAPAGLKALLGYYTFALDIPGPDDGLEAVPQGVSFGSFTVASTGNLVSAGKLADGTAFTSSTFVGPAGQVLVYEALYSNLGSIVGSLALTAGTGPLYLNNTLAGTVNWLRPAVITATAHTYKAGFGPMDLSAVGGRYETPVTPIVILGQNDSGGGNNTQLQFTQGGISGTIADPHATTNSPNIDLRVKAGGVVVYPSPNTDLLTLAVSPTTGAFSGKFTLIGDLNPAITSPPTNLIRTSYYYGIIVPTGGKLVGYGYFLLNRRPVPTVPPAVPQTLANTDILSGQVVFEAFP